MSVAFVFEGSGITADRYDTLMEQIGRADVSGANPGGLVAHLAGPIGGGWRVLDIWESEDAADTFYGSDIFQRTLQGAPPMDREPWSLHRVEIHQAVRELGAGG
jgi:hypothetical protein